MEKILIDFTRGKGCVGDHRDPRTKIVFPVRNYPTPGALNGTWLCQLVKDTKPEDPRRGALIVQPLPNRGITVDIKGWLVRTWFELEQGPLFCHYYEEDWPRREEREAIEKEKKRWEGFWENQNFSEVIQPPEGMVISPSGAGLCLCPRENEDTPEVGVKSPNLGVDMGEREIIYQLSLARKFFGEELEKGVGFLKFRVMGENKKFKFSPVEAAEEAEWEGETTLEVDYEKKELRLTNWAGVWTESLYSCGDGLGLKNRFLVELAGKRGFKLNMVGYSGSSMSPFSSAGLGLDDWDDD